MKWLLPLMLFLLFSETTLAQNQKGKRVIEIDFEDELVQGDIQKPELFYLLQRKRFNFNRMLQLREDFIPEMESTGKKLELGDFDK
ncbi:MAG: hypothetical protein AB8E15_09295 [Bdellovibrionales bacterium]